MVGGEGVNLGYLAGHHDLPIRHRPVIRESPYFGSWCIDDGSRPDWIMSLEDRYGIRFMAFGEE